MMTAAFDKFMRQYKMTGSEKADGYSRDVFIGLDSHEKEEVFKLLVTELPFSVEWLFFLDAKNALDVVKHKEEKLRGNGYKHVYMLQEKLVNYTGDLSYQNHMIEDYYGYADYLRPLVVDSIGRTPPNTATVDFLKKVIVTDTNADAVDNAARELLNALQVPHVTETDDKNYERLVKGLCSENLSVKMQAVSRISKFRQI